VFPNISKEIYMKTENCTIARGYRKDSDKRMNKLNEKGVKRQWTKKGEKENWERDGRGWKRNRGDKVKK
jgi:hypothetical protein